VSLRNLLTRDVIIATANWALIALVDISFRALQPVFLSTPVALGGLGLDPPAIGTILSFSGILSGVFTVFFFSRMTDYFGVKWVYMIGVSAAVPCFSLFPIMNYLARNSVERSGGLGLEVWAAVGLQVLMVVLNCMCYGTSARSKSNFHWNCFPQARCPYSSPPPRPIRPPWGPRMDWPSSPWPSCVRSAPLW